MRLLLTALLLVACGDDAKPTNDTSVASDTTIDSTETVGTLAFHPASATGEAVVLRAVSLGTDQVTIEVALSGFQSDDQVFSIGARLSYDPTVLSFIEATPGEAWTEVKAANGDTPGIVVLGVAYPHAFFEQPGPPVGDVVVYRVTFAVTRVVATPIALVAERSRAVVWPGPSSDPQRRLSISWVGGELTYE